MSRTPALDNPLDPADLPSPASVDRWEWLQRLRAGVFPLEPWLAAIEAGGVPPESDLMVVLAERLDAAASVRMLRWWLAQPLRMLQGWQIGGLRIRQSPQQHRSTTPVLQLGGQAQEFSRNLSLGSPVHQQKQGTARHTPQTSLQPLPDGRLQGPRAHLQKAAAGIGQSGQAVYGGGGL